ncbi:MAG: isomerase [SAR86 cluster bacterium]|uniref:Isomerase n=1 Tax=SAR86 cluster bacterium TaxID=2030880 RepID=A0A2A4X9K8_9GAMM|nr:MAG: isomerase [SAR86 cluster bacterium]
MKINVYQVDAFANKPFEGNPAAICPLQEWLPEQTMQALAAENNLSETAFFVAEGDGFALRWFTPATEVDLCGHATLAAAYVLFEELDYQGEEIRFSTKSGTLSVMRNGDSLRMDFPAQPPLPFELPAQLVEAFAATPEDCLKFADIVAVFPSEELVRTADPDMLLLAQLDCRGIIITAESTEYDFIARWFGPRTGIEEDPVTGSAFTQLVPYWANRLGKTEFRAKQVSERGGEVTCELVGDRVLISGKAVLFMRGVIEIDV